MAHRLTFGRYYAAKSPVRSLDPRAKLVCSLVIMVSVFFIRTPAELAFGWTFALALLALARIPAGKVLASIRPAIVVLVVLSVFNLVLVRDGSVLAQVGPLTITTRGAWAAALYPLRIIIAVIAATVVLMTTTPTQLTDAFDAMLAPLSRVGLPGHELAMVFSLMMRFIPMLADETQAILDAQTARGGALAEGSLARRVRSVVPVVVALLASSLRHADGLSRALDARCYENGRGRTHWHPLHLGARDAMAALVTCVYVAALVLL